MCADFIRRVKAKEKKAKGPVPILFAITTAKTPVAKGSRHGSDENPQLTS